MMHRTQLILDEVQYDGIRAIAESAGVSLSSVVREAVSDTFPTATPRRTLRSRS